MNSLVDPFIECRVDKWCQTTLSNMLPVQVSIVFPFPNQGLNWITGRAMHPTLSNKSIHFHACAAACVHHRVSLR